MNNALGLIAGKGLLPLTIIQTCLEQGRSVVVIWIDQGDPIPEILSQTVHQIVNIAAVGKTIKFLKKHHVSQLVFAGSIHRPSWTSLRPDAGGLKLLSQLKNLKQQGDNSLLSLIIRFFETQDFSVIGVQHIVPELLISAGTHTKCLPTAEVSDDINKGKHIIQLLSDEDIGQSIVLQQGVVLGIEAIEGTDKLIERCGTYTLKGSKPILIKRKKKNQDARIDLPTIGLNTVEQCFKSGFQGIAVEAGQTLILDKDAVIKALNHYGMFLIGT